MRNSSSLDWLRFMHTPNDYRVSPFLSDSYKQVDWEDHPVMTMIGREASG
jgi:hypothetical protein